VTPNGCVKCRKCPVETRCFDNNDNSQNDAKFQKSVIIGVLLRRFRQSHLIDVLRKYENGLDHPLTEGFLRLTHLQENQPLLDFLLNNSEDLLWLCNVPVEMQTDPDPVLHRLFWDIVERVLKLKDEVGWLGHDPDDQDDDPAETLWKNMYLAAFWVDIARNNVFSDEFLLDRDH